MEHKENVRIQIKGQPPKNLHFSQYAQMIFFSLRTKENTS